MQQGQVLLFAGKRCTVQYVNSKGLLDLRIDGDDGVVYGVDPATVTEIKAQVTVPAGVAAGQPLAVQTPAGAMVQAIVPEGMKEGDIFIVTDAVQPAAMVREPLLPAAEDAAAARELAAQMVGQYRVDGSGCPGIFCPLIWQSPQTIQGQYTIQPLNAHQQYTLTGKTTHWVCPYLGLPCSVLHVCPIGSLTMSGEFSADGTTSHDRQRNPNANRSEGEPIGCPWEISSWATTIERKLTSIDAKALRATFSIAGQGPLGKISGTREVDGRARTITDQYEGGLFIGRIKVSTVATKVS